MKKNILVTDAVLQQIETLVDNIASQVKRNQYSGWETIYKQTEVVVPCIGLIGIEVFGLEYPRRYFSGAFYRKNGDEWKKCWSFPIPADGRERLKEDLVEQIYCYYYRILKDKKNMERRKYIKGDPIQSINELLHQEFVFFHHKVTHRGWFMSWQLRMADDMIRRGVLFHAIRKEDRNV